MGPLTVLINLQNRQVQLNKENTMQGLDQCSRELSTEEECSDLCRCKDCFDVEGCEIVFEIDPEWDLELNKGDD